MNTDIRIETTFKGHRKRRRLNEILQCEATGYLLDLWITIAQERPMGILTDWDAKDISLAAGWNGDAQQFVDALQQAKLLDVNGNKVFRPHDWEEHQPWICGTSDRKEAARKAGIASSIARANKRNTKSTKPNRPLKVVAKALVNGMATTGQPRTLTGPGPLPDHTSTKETTTLLGFKVEKKWFDTLKVEFPDIDLTFEEKRCLDWWTGQGKKIKNAKFAFRNWLNKAKQIKEKGSKSGLDTDKGHPKEKYTDPQTLLY